MHLQFCTATCHAFVQEFSMASLLTYLTESCIVTVLLLAKTREGVWNRLKPGHREWCIKMRVVVVKVLEIIVILIIVTWRASLVGAVFQVFPLQVLQYWVQRKQKMANLCHIIMRVPEEISSGLHQKCLPVKQGCHLPPSLIYPCWAQKLLPLPPPIQVHRGEVPGTTPKPWVDLYLLYIPSYHLKSQWCAVKALPLLSVFTPCPCLLGLPCPLHPQLVHFPMLEQNHCQWKTNGKKGNLSGVGHLEVFMLQPIGM